MAKSPNRIRLAVFLFAAVTLGGFSIWLRQRTASLPQEESLENVSIVSLEDYLFRKELFLRDVTGQVKMDTVLLPLPPEKEEPKVPASHGNYLGPQACVECHREKYESFVQTSHFKTSALPTSETLLGAFEPGKNVFQSQSENLRFEMLSEDEKFWQRLVLNVDGEEFAEEFPIDLITGSGKVGQTYLYWRDTHLYQLHVSYLTAADAWINSPGYHDGVADYARPTLNHCLECHTTYFQPVDQTLNQFQKEHFVLGVTCEKCHGPGKEHVDFHQAHPEEKQATGIVNPGSLSPERSLEVCQLCHGGEPEQILQLPFAYRPGEPLDDYYKFKQNDQLVGVHSNSQLPRLKQSKCFQQSEAMTCVDCHNPHQFERGNFKLFSDRCMNCHEATHCGMAEQVGPEVLTENCIDCHMASRNMEDIVLVSGDKTHSPPMRDHFIKVWPAETKKFLESLVKQQAK